MFLIEIIISLNQTLYIELVTLYRLLAIQQHTLVRLVSQAQILAAAGSVSV